MAKMPRKNRDAGIAPLRLYRELRGLDNLILLEEPTLTTGMDKVARLGEDWENHPELKWQVWPEDLQEMSKPSHRKADH